MFGGKVARSGERTEKEQSRRRTGRSHMASGERD